MPKLQPRLIMLTYLRFPITGLVFIFSLLGFAQNSYQWHSTLYAPITYGPYGIAVDNVGNLVVSFPNANVQKFTVGGTLLFRIDAKKRVENGAILQVMESPGGVATDKEGNIYVSDIATLSELYKYRGINKWG